MLCAFLFNDSAQNDVAEWKLKGKVKSMKILHFEAKIQSGKVIKGKLIPEPPAFQNVLENGLFLFNENGYIIERHYFTYKEATKYQYDAKHNMTTMYRYHQGKNDTIDYYQIKYKYNQQGKIIEEKECSFHSTWKIIYTYKYNTNGLLTEKIYHDEKKKIIDNYKYDAKGKLIEENTPRDYTIKKRTHKYDDKGNLAETSGYGTNKDSSYYIAHIYKYDAKENIIEETRKSSKVIYEYDNSGLEIKKQYYLENDSLSSSTTYEYKFDAIGNWIQQTKSVNNSPEYILEREIKYFQ